MILCSCTNQFAIPVLDMGIWQMQTGGTDRNGISLGNAANPMGHCLFCFCLCVLGRIKVMSAMGNLAPSIASSSSRGKYDLGTTTRLVHPRRE